MPQKSCSEDARTWCIWMQLGKIYSFSCSNPFLLNLTDGREAMNRCINYIELKKAVEGREKYNWLVLLNCFLREVCMGKLKGVRKKK